MRVLRKIKATLYIHAVDATRHFQTTGIAYFDSKKPAATEFEKCQAIDAYSRGIGFAQGDQQR